MIRLQFAAMRDPASEAIKLFSRGWPSHVDAVLPDGSLLGARDDLVGGQPRGVQIRPPGYCPFEKTLIIDLAATKECEEKFLAFGRAQIGKPYDTTAILAFPFERDWRDPDAWFCSEIWTRGLEISLWFPREVAVAANEVTPRDLLLMVSPWAQGAPANAAPAPGAAPGA